MTRDLDPDRRRPAPPHPGFESIRFESIRPEIPVRLCKLCGCAVVDTPNALIVLTVWDNQIRAMAIRHGSPPAPPATHAAPGGVDGANQEPAPTPGSIPPPGTASPVPGGAKRAGRDTGGGSGKGPVHVPAGTTLDPEQVELLEWEQAHAAPTGNPARFAR